MNWRSQAISLHYFSSFDNLHIHGDHVCFLLEDCLSGCEVVKAHLFIEDNNQSMHYLKMFSRGGDKLIVCSPLALHKNTYDFFHNLEL